MKVDKKGAEVLGDDRLFSKYSKKNMTLVIMKAPHLVLLGQFKI